MGIEAALFSLVTADSDVSALISQRLYPDRLPQDTTYPAATYSVVSDAETMAHDGPAGYDSIRVQFDFYAVKRSDCRSLADATRSVLNGYKGTTASVAIHGIFFENDVSNWGDVLIVYRFTHDYIVTYLRT